jgi:hypothetical protein
MLHDILEKQRPYELPIYDSLALLMDRCIKHYELREAQKYSRETFGRTLAEFFKDPNETDALLLYIFIKGL